MSENKFIVLWDHDYEGLSDSVFDSYDEMARAVVNGTSRIYEIYEVARTVDEAQVRTGWSSKLASRVAGALAKLTPQDRAVLGV